MKRLTILLAGLTILSGCGVREVGSFQDQGRGRETTFYSNKAKSKNHPQVKMDPRESPVNRGTSGVVSEEDVFLAACRRHELENEAASVGGPEFESASLDFSNCPTAENSRDGAPSL